MGLSTTQGVGCPRADKLHAGVLLLPRRRRHPSHRHIVPLTHLIFRRTSIVVFRFSANLIGNTDSAITFPILTWLYTEIRILVLRRIMSLYSPSHQTSHFVLGYGYQCWFVCIGRRKSGNIRSDLQQNPDQWSLFQYVQQSRKIEILNISSGHQT